MLGDEALVQQFIAHAGREGEIVGNHGVLPGDGVFTHIRVLVIVPLPQDAVVHRVVHQVQAPFAQHLQLPVVFGQETHIVVGGRNVYPARLGGIHLGQGLLHIGHCVRIVQLFSQLDHIVVQPVLGQAGLLGLFRAGYSVTGQKQQHRDEQKFSHNLQYFSPQN